MDNLEISYDHYKETFGLIKENEKNRNKIFIILSILIAALYLLGVDPQNSYKTLNDLANEHLNIKIYFTSNIVNTLIWIITLYFTVRYFQIVAHIERQYDYLHKIEEEINSKIDTTFSREGKSYLNKYPLLLNIIYYIYTGVFPLIYIIVVSYKLYLEWQLKNNIATFILNGIIGILIIVLTIAYLVVLHKREVEEANVLEMAEYEN